MFYTANLRIIFQLSVSFNQILYKLRVTEISGACVMLVHRANLSHIVVTQREVEDVDILRHTLLMATIFVLPTSIFPTA